MIRKRAYVYTRVSTGMQVEGYSLAAQEERIKQYANAFNIEIVQTYQDAGRSGKSILGRERFLEMLNNIESEKDNIEKTIVDLNLKDKVILRGYTNEALKIFEEAGRCRRRLETRQA